jgi:hypothetical protein
MPSRAARPARTPVSRSPARGHLKLCRAEQLHAPARCTIDEARIQPFARSILHQDAHRLTVRHRVPIPVLRIRTHLGQRGFLEIGSRERKEVRGVEQAYRERRGIQGGRLTWSGVEYERGGGGVHHRPDAAGGAGRCRKSSFSLAKSTFTTAPVALGNGDPPPAPRSGPSFQARHLRIKDVPMPPGRGACRAFVKPSTSARRSP